MLWRYTTLDNALGLRECSERCMWCVTDAAAAAVIRSVASSKQVVLVLVLVLALGEYEAA